MKPAITIKLGGSLLYDSSMGLRTSLIKEFEKVLEIIMEKYRVFVITGGGKITRKYSHMLQDLLNHAELDQVAIEFSRIHAFIVAKTLKKLNPTLISRYEEILSSAQNSLYIVGGFYPNQSTNGTAALVAEMTDSELFINLFSYDGIHEKDPEVHGKQKMYHRISYDEFEALISHFKQEPGHYELFDHNAFKIVLRSKIPVRFVNGNSMDNILKVVNGEEIGTLLT